jgi:hypothetical protein
LSRLPHAAGWCSTTCKLFEMVMCVGEHVSNQMFDWETKPERSKIWRGALPGHAVFGQVCARTSRRVRSTICQKANGDTDIRVDVTNALGWIGSFADQI